MSGWFDVKRVSTWTFSKRDCFPISPEEDIKDCVRRKDSGLYGMLLFSPGISRTEQVWVSVSSNIFFNYMLPATAVELNIKNKHFSNSWLCLIVGRWRQGRSASGVSVGTPGPGPEYWALGLSSVVGDNGIVEWAHRQQGRCRVSCPPDLAHAVLLRTFHGTVPIRYSWQESHVFTYSLFDCRSTHWEARIGSCLHVFFDINYSQKFFYNYFYKKYKKIYKFYQ